MSITSKIREQIISTFRAEVSEHIQTISDGLLVIEKQQQTPEERQSLLEVIFRAAHSMKGAARAVGVTAIEQLGHGLENILSDLQKGVITPSPELFTTCYHALDAIQIVDAAYANGETTPPLQALQALTELEMVRISAKSSAMPVQPHLEAVTPEVIDLNIPAEKSGVENPPDKSAGDVIFSANPAEPQAPATTQVNRTDETIRVRVEKLDSVIAQLGELVMAKIRLDQRRVQIANLQNMVAEWQKDWSTARDQYTQAKYTRKGSSIQTVDDEGEKRSADLWMTLLPAQSQIKEVSNKINELARDYANDTVNIALVIDAIEQEFKQIRLLPLNTITSTFGRMVRNLAASTEKDVDFVIKGGEVEMDKRVLELVKDPLIHMLRNAIDHGIETTSERQASHKPVTGKLILSAEHMGKDVVLRVIDDGRGLDMKAIREVINQQTGLDSREMSEPELIGWIFNAGITTSPSVTDVSGRGVGLDVVRRNVEALQGRIDVSSTPGGGTTFTLTIPMALTSSHVLLVQAAQNEFALPLSAIERIIPVKNVEVSSVNGKEVLRYNDRPMPLVHLKNILNLPDQEGQAPKDGYDRLAVIISAADRRIALIVDELSGEQEIVIKGLGKQLVRVGGIAGATVLGSGKVVLVLNAADLIRLAARSENRSGMIFHPAANKPKKKHVTRRILVVDDSITTRTLEKHILEAEGFIVTVATDGQEALSTIATSGLPDLVISDINMPRVTGFELTSRLKTDPRTGSIPVILVSSNDSTEDKAKGVQVGADAYIVKSRFDQGNLLEIIQQLIR